MSILAVAGISGYTGLSMLPLLGKDDRLLLRSKTAEKSPWRDDPRTRSVNLLDESSIAPALAGVDVVVCLVGTTKAQFRPAAGDEPAVNYETVDIGIPRALANAGKTAGCKRFVLLSSYGIDSGPGAYPKAKREAEAFVLASGLAWTIVRPSFIVGPGRRAASALDVFWLPFRPFRTGFAEDLRAIDGATLAKAIFAIAQDDSFVGKIVTGRELHRLA